MWEHHIVTIVVICILLLHSTQLILKAVDDVLKTLLQLMPVIKELTHQLKSLF